MTRENVSFYFFLTLSQSWYIINEETLEKGSYMIPLGYISGLGYAIACLILSLVLYKLGMPKKYTRKVVHILVGFEWIFLYNFFGAGIHFLVVCVFFLILLSVAYKGNLMPMISSDEDNAPGTVYYAVAMTGVAIVGCFVPEVMLPFGVGIFCTSIGDGFAGVVGQLIKKNNPKIYGNKSLYGFLANFVASFLSAFIMNAIFEMKLEFWHCAIIGFVSAMLEMITGFGLDNISITWGVTALTYMFMYLENVGNYLVPIIATPIIIAVVIKKKALTRGGLIWAMVMDVVVSIALGNFGFVLLCTFLVCSILIDKIKKNVKKSKRIAEGVKGDERDYMQVLANGLMPMACAALFIFTHKNIFVFAYTVAIAEAFADTAASGFGVFAKKTFDLFRFRPCTNGLSGGMSVIGTLSSLVASIFICFIAFLFGAIRLELFLIGSLIAFLGGVFDSLLGSLLQVKYKCQKCGEITEKPTHCGIKTVKYTGFEIVDNDIVNISSGFFATILAILVYLIVY